MKYACPKWGSKAELWKTLTSIGSDWHFGKRKWTNYKQTKKHLNQISDNNASIPRKMITFQQLSNPLFDSNFSKLLKKCHVNLNQNLTDVGVDQLEEVLIKQIID